MIETTNIPATVILQGNTLVFLARIVGVAQTVVTQASVASAAYTLKTLDGTAIASGTLTVSAVVFDTPLTTYGWDVDTTGYNFRHILTGSNFSGGDECEYKLTLVDSSGYPLVVAHRFRVEATA